MKTDVGGRVHRQVLADADIEGRGLAEPQCAAHGQDQCRVAELGQGAVVEGTVGIELELEGTGTPASGAWRGGGG